MSSLAISGTAFACGFGGALLGMILRALLPEKHLSAESKDLVRLGMGLIGTMTALVLGLLAVSSAVFLFLELDRPFGGVIQISSVPLRDALEQLGR
jgi:hypothetical protein